MLYCTLLYSTVLYCAVLYWTLLNLSVLYWTLLNSSVLYCTPLDCTVLYSTVLYCAVLYWTLLYSTLLFGVVLYYTQLSSTVLYFDVQTCETWTSMIGSDLVPTNQVCSCLGAELIQTPLCRTGLGNWQHATPILKALSRGLNLRVRIVQCLRCKFQIWLCISVSHW